MAQNFTTGLNVANTTNEVSLKVTQTTNNEAVQVVQNSGKMGLRVTKVSSNADTAASIFNMGGGYGLYVQQDGNTAAAVVKHNGAGTTLYINKASTGAGTPIVINNAGPGNDIVGHNSSWYIGKTGDATFANVNCGCGQVTAKNTAIAGGRVHIYQRVPQGPIVADVWCDWGLARTPVVWGPSIIGGPALAATISFEMPVTCPIIKVMPWAAGQYDESQHGLFTYAGQHTNVPLLPPQAIEPQITQLILLPSTTCVIGFEVYFQCCIWGNPAVQECYEVVAGLPNHDLVFDFEVLGCVCMPD